VGWLALKDFHDVLTETGQHVLNLRYGHAWKSRGDPHNDFIVGRLRAGFEFLGDLSFFGAIPDVAKAV
jgi:hypothetical protein